VEKRAVWSDWMLDFLVDVANATLYPEEVAPGPTGDPVGRESILGTMRSHRPCSALRLVLLLVATGLALAGPTGPPRAEARKTKRD